MFMGAKVLNELPLELRKIENYNENLRSNLKIIFNDTFSFSKSVSLLLDLFITINISSTRHRVQDTH